MEPLVLQRQTENTVVESWDDDDDLQGTLELKSSAISVTGARNRVDRGSISSPMSFKNDGGFDWDGEDDDDEDEEDQIFLAPEGDFKFAIESAKRAGIPLPQNIPSSALMGGTIKRLGTKNQRAVTHDDWSEDLELPSSGGLAVKTGQFTDFPSNLQLHHLSAPHMPAPRQSITASKMLASVNSAASELNSALSKYQESDNDDWDGDDIPTLRASKLSARKTFGGLLSPPLSASRESPEEDNFDSDFVLPEGNSLELQLKHSQSRAPAEIIDSDIEEWVDGGRPSHKARSTRSSSVSMMSPTLSSVHTFESEDEGLDGLQLPDGPIDFEEILEKRKQNETPDMSLDFELHRKATKEDFLSGLEIGDGDIFDPAKLTLNRNVKHKTTRQLSPVRRTAVELAFTQADVVKTTSTVPAIRQSRIPRPQGSLAAPIPALDSVAESRPSRKPHHHPHPQHSRHPNSQVVDHSAFGQMGSFFHPHPTPPPSVQAGGPRLRPMGKRVTNKIMPTQQTQYSQQSQPVGTTSAQYLKLKRSYQNIRQTLHQVTRVGRPPSRTDTPNPMSVLNSVRPATPNDKKETPSMPPPTRRPFIPAGSSVKQSHNVNVKTSNRHHRTQSDDTEKGRPTSRLSVTRQNRDTPPLSAKAVTQAVAPESLRKEAAATKLLTRPTKKRNFGDGTELEVFDDLPTSKTVEQKFMKEPVGRGAPRALRARSMPTQTPPPPSTPPVAKVESTQSKTPNFAKDTNASRTAREQRIAALASSPAATHWKNMIAARGSPKTRPVTKKPPQKRPHLIKPLGNQSSIPKAVKGMTYNPRTFVWEGNEQTLEDFDRHQAVTPPRPALITNINTNASGISKGIQIVGGMVFDPQRMCWLKVSGSDDDDESDSDPFEGMDDLLDEVVSVDGTAVSGLGTSCGEWMVGEEFDVGPEFVRRQREEEERWRRRLDGWVGGSLGTSTGLRGESGEMMKRRWELWNLVTDN